MVFNSITAYGQCTNNREINCNKILPSEYRGYTIKHGWRMDPLELSVWTASG